MSDEVDPKKEIDNTEVGLHDPFSTEKAAAKLKVLAEDSTVKNVLLVSRELVLVDGFEIGYIHGVRPNSKDRTSDMITFGVIFSGFTGTLPSDEGERFTIDENDRREYQFAFTPGGITDLLATMATTYFPGDLLEELFTIIRKRKEEMTGKETLDNLFSGLDKLLKKEGGEDDRT